MRWLNMLLAVETRSVNIAELNDSQAIGSAVYILTVFAVIILPVVMMLEQATVSHNCNTIFFTT